MIGVVISKFLFISKLNALQNYVLQEHLHLIRLSKNLPKLLNEFEFDLKI
jgi:hypothetical protein